MEVIWNSKEGDNVTFYDLCVDPNGHASKLCFEEDLK